MKATSIAMFMIIVLAGDNGALAADMPVLRTLHHARPVTAAHHHRVAYRARFKLIGMPCVLPPHVIVARNWNGPQCRWVDNVILP